MQGVSPEFIEAVTRPILGPFTEADTKTLDALRAYTILSTAFVTMATMWTDITIPPADTTGLTAT